MDRAMKERLLGAAVLVVIVVLVVPALLTGPRETVVEEAPAPGLRSVEIELAEAAPEPEAPPSDPALEAAARPPPSPAATAPAEKPPEARPGPDSVPAAPPAAGATGEATTPGPPVSSQSGWAVQVAALSRSEAARDLASRLRERGYPAFVMEYRADGKVFYRVRVGPEITRENAAVLAERLAKDGQDGVVVGHP